MDGHNLQDLVAILEEVKSTRSVGPVLIHTVTERVGDTLMQRLHRTSITEFPRST